MSNWTVIDDTKLRHIWRCVECKDEATVKPWWYEDNGTPICGNCDEDMHYLATEYNDE